MAIHLHSDAPLGDYLYPADETRRAAVSEVADWRIGKSLASPSTAQSCSGTEFTQNKRGYAPATINFRLAAVRRVAYEAADAGLLSPELAAGIRRVKGVRRIGVRLGNRLTPEEGRQLLEHAEPATPRQLRDHAMLAMLIGCGLRRG